MKRSKAGKKAARQTKARTIINNKMKDRINSTERKFRKNPTPETLKAVYSILDKGVKTGVIHKNTAAHQKSKYSKMIKAKPVEKAAKKEKTAKKEAKPASEKK